MTQQGIAVRRSQSLNKRVMPKPNLRFVSRMAFGHFMRFTTLPVWLGIHGRYANQGK